MLRAFLLAVTMLASGCATFFASSLDPPSPPVVSINRVERPEAGLEISVKEIAKPRGFLLWDCIGYALDFSVLGAAILSQGASFSINKDSSVLLIAGSLLGVALDCWLNDSLHNNRSPERIIMGASSHKEEAPLSQSGERYLAYFPLKPWAEFPANLVVESGKGTLYRGPIQLSGEWGRSPLNVTVPDSLPPKLAFWATIEEPLGDRAIHANEGGTIVLNVTNVGQGIASGLEASFKALRTVTGLSIPLKYPVGTLYPGETSVVRVPVQADRTLPDAGCQLLITLEDNRHYDAPPVRLSFETRRQEPVFLALEQVGASSNAGDGMLNRGEQTDIQALVRNQGRIPARDVQARLSLGDSGLMAVGAETLALGSILGGGFKVATFSIFVKHSYEGPQNPPIYLHVSERTGISLDSKLPFALAPGSPVFSDVAVQPLQPQMGGEDPVLLADVDRPLPKTAPLDPDAVALVVGIERYHKLPKASYAQRDALTVKRYLTEGFGVPSENLILLTDTDATKANLQLAIEEKLKRYVTPGKSRLYVYYSGHGAPDLKSKGAYLIPYDGEPDYPSVTCYSTATLYETLGKLGAKSVTVFLDACFTGQGGRGVIPVSLLADARPLYLEALAPVVPAGVTVLAASGANQLSSGFPEKRHGLFTYFLLKGLRGEIPGRVTFSSLHRYVCDQVTRQARRMGREQTPLMVGGRGERILLER